MAARGERVQLALGTPGGPGTQVVEVGAARLVAPALDEERGDQPPERVGVELGLAELAARQSLDRGDRQRRRRNRAMEFELAHRDHARSRW